MLGSRCHTVVTVAWHTHCKQSPDVLLTHRAKELRRAPSLSWRQRQSLGWSSPFQVQCWTLLLLPCPCFKNAMSTSSTSTVPVCQTPLLWLSLLNQSLCNFSLFLSVQFCVSLFGSSSLFGSYQQQPGGQSPSPKAMLFLLEFALPILTQCLPMADLFAIKANWTQRRCAFMHISFLVQALPAGMVTSVSCTKHKIWGFCFATGWRIRKIWSLWGEESLLYHWFTWVTLGTLKALLASVVSPRISLHPRGQRKRHVDMFSGTRW